MPRRSKYVPSRVIAGTCSCCIHLVVTVTPERLPLQSLGTHFTVNCSSKIAGTMFWFYLLPGEARYGGYVRESLNFTTEYSPTDQFGQLHIIEAPNGTLFMCYVRKEGYHGYYCVSDEILILYYGEN